MRIRADGSFLLELACRLAVIVAYPVSRGRLLLSPPASPVTDVALYFEYTRRAAAGETPYLDYPIEYPPAGWLMMRAPAAADWVTYAHRFARLAVGLEIAAFVLFLLIARRIAPRRFWLVGATYVIVTTVMRELVSTRLDTGLLVLLMIWVWLMTTTRDGSDGSSGVRRAAAYAVLGLATSFKLAPVVMLPFALVRDEERPRRLHALMWFAVGLAAPFVAMWPSAGAAPVRFLAYHVGRGVEIESVWATAIWLLRWLDQPVSVAHMGHAVEIVSPWSPMVASLSLAASAGAAALCLAVERRRPWQGLEVVGSIVGLAVFVALSKVLSPQYFLWLLPLLLLAGVHVLQDDRSFQWWCAAAIAVSVLTWLIYPRFFGAVFEMRPLGFWLVFSRNAFLLAMLAGFARRVWVTPS